MKKIEFTHTPALKQKFKAGFVFLLIILAGFTSHLYAQTYVYVKHNAAGNNNGTSWTDAYTSLQHALGAATTGHHIWVAAGTYSPEAEVGGSGIRYRSFQLKNGVGLYGGFAGTENPATFNLNDRDFDASETILSGATDQVYHVFRHVNLGLNSTAILDGFTISGGKADGSDPDNKGGGILNSVISSTNGSSPTIRNCIFKDNLATEGGAMFNSRYSSPTINNTVFSNNVASEVGGAVFITRNNTAFDGCTFQNNSAQAVGSSKGGGAVYISTSANNESITFTDCSFIENAVNKTSTGARGGAIHALINPGKLTITGSNFQDNEAQYGGAVYHSSGSPVNRDASEVSISNSTFEQNYAEYGGAIFSDMHNTQIIACIIRGNESVEQSGGYYGRNGSTRLINTLLSGNKSAKHGGGAYFNTETPELINTTVTGNFSGERGGGISMIGGSTVAIKNSIVWGNASPEGNELWLCATCTANIDYSLYGNATGDVFITSGGILNATNSLTSDPLFLNHIAPSSGNTPNSSGNYMIKSTSPTVDAANNSHVPGSLTKDLRGRDRIIDGDGNSTATVDMGAYEYDPDYCNSIAPSIGDGSSATPYQISTLGHLCWISQNSGEWSKYFVQTADIDASDTEFWNDGAGFNPIGNSATIFNGSYNGNNFFINGLFIDRSTTDDVGFFGQSRGVLSYINLLNVNVTGKDNVGALVGFNRYSNALINNCYSTGDIFGNEKVGGLVGLHESNANITTCSSHCNIEAAYRVGGLVGRSNGGHINSSFATGNVTGTGNGASPNLSNAGGFVGGMVGSSTATNCYSTGKVAGFSNTGGFVGSMNGSTISKCFSKGDVTTSGASAAGFIGLQTTGLVDNCYSHGNIVRTAGTSTWNGGFVGRNYRGKILKSYSKGKVIYENGTNPTDRGFAGPVDTGGDYEMAGNFWDTETSLQSTTQGNATGKTTSEMKTQSTFISAGWDFNSTWSISLIINSGYPYFLLNLITWTGETDSDWGKANNWNPAQLPSFDNSVTIPGNLANYPKLDQNRTIGSLTVAAGASLSIPPQTGLTINGTFTNNATATGLVIKSDVTGTGSLIHSTAGVNVTMERYMNNADWSNWKDGWHFLGSPVIDQAISPAFTADPYDFYLWNEPTNQWVNFKNQSTNDPLGDAPYFDLVNGSNNFTLGRGYMAAYDAEGVKSFSGVLNVANVSRTGLGISGGGNKSWHLLGNPFSSALTWDASAAWGFTNIAGVAKIWNEAIQSYTDLTSTPSTVIPATNGFMVQVSVGTGSLTIPAAKRVHSSQDFYKSTVSGLMLTARSLAAGNAQEAKIIVNPDATSGFDLMFDSEFLAGHAPSFYAVAGEFMLSTNSLPVLTAETEIPFAFIKNDGNHFSIEASGIENISATPYLIDLKTGTSQNLADNPVYNFTAEEGDNPNRFLLKFQMVSIEENPETAQTAIYSHDQSVYISSTESTEAVISIFNITGQQVYSSRMMLDGQKQITLNVPTGFYVVQVVTTENAVSRKVFIQ